MSLETLDTYKAFSVISSMNDIKTTNKEEKPLTCDGCWQERPPGNKLCPKCLKIYFQKKYLARRDKKPKIKCLTCKKEIIQNKKTQKFCKACYSLALKLLPQYVERIFKAEIKETERLAKLAIDNPAPIV